MPFVSFALTLIWKSPDQPAYTALIVLLVVCGVAASIYTSPPTPRTVSRAATPSMRDMAVGTDDEFMEDVDPEVETVKTLERLLSDSGVGKGEGSIKRPLSSRYKNSQSGASDKAEMTVDRI